MNKADLLANRLPTRTHAIAGVGDVTVRGMSHQEALRCNQLQADQDAMYQWILTQCLVDPPLTTDEVTQWRTMVPAHEIEEIAAIVLELSGLGEPDASKSNGAGIGAR